MFRRSTQKTAVELIPWHHDVATSNHERIIKYIQTLPKNSHLALEVNPNKLANHYKMMNALALNDWNKRDEILTQEYIHETRSDLIFDKIKKNNINKKLQQEKKMFRKSLARIRSEPTKKFKTKREKMLIDTMTMIMYDLPWLEVLQECRKRNIRIIALESEVGRLRALRAKGFEDMGSTKHFEEIDKGTWGSYAHREKGFAEQIETTLKKFRGQKLYVLTGYLHSEPLKKELTKRRIKSTINTKIYPKQKRIRTLMNLGAKERHMAKKVSETEKSKKDKIINKMLMVSLKQSIISSMMSRLETPDLVMKRIIENEKKYMSKIKQPKTKRTLEAKKKYVPRRRLK